MKAMRYAARMLCSGFTTSTPPLMSRWRRIAVAASVAVMMAQVAAGDAPPVPRSDDPGRDGWQTEVFYQAAGDQLHHVAELLEQPSSPAAAEALRSVAAADFACAALRPELREVFSDGSLRVWRQAGDSPADRYRGAGGLIAALRGLIEPLGGAVEVHAKLKIIGVELGTTRASTRLIYELSGRAGGDSFEQHATWQAGWLRRPDEPPRLHSLRPLGDFEETRFSGAGSTQFSDRTAAVLAHNASFTGQLMRGTWSWLGELEAALGPDIMGHTGLAIGDVDGDGLEDLYACQLGGLPNRLYLHQADGTASDRSAWAGVDWLDRSQSALLIDLDNDGDKDLVVGTAPALILMANDGRGRFTVRAVFEAISYAYSLAAADYDLDGDLDLYATRYTPLSSDPGAVVDVPSPMPYHDAENGAANYLLRNDGDWRFTDDTAGTGLDADNRRWSFAASWEDYDNDGDPDLYVANDFGRNCLYRNQWAESGVARFLNVAAEAGVEDIASGMSASWGDVDRDGRMDLYVGNMFSSAGNRITFQDRFQPSMSAEERARVQRLARGNSLFLNRGVSGFADASLDAGVTRGRWAWGSIFADLNNDGWQDLFVANGYLTTPDSHDL